MLVEFNIAFTDTIHKGIGQFRHHIALAPLEVVFHKPFAYKLFRELALLFSLVKAFLVAVGIEVTRAVRGMYFVNQVDFTVEYRNDLHGGLDTEFYLSEIGIFARDADGAEVMVYYGTLGDYAIRVQPYVQNGLVIRDFPVSIALSDEPEVVIEYNAGAYMTAQQVADYCTIVVLPMFLAEAATLIVTHNLDPTAHPYLLGLIGQLDSRLSLIELQYGTDVNGNPFRVTFENLDSVDVAGVWNQSQARIEF